MILKNRQPLLMTIIYVAVSFLFTSCSPLLPMSDSIKKDKHSKIVSPMIPKQFEQSPYSDIEQKGDAEIKAGNYRSALNIYNNLLSKYSGADKKRLLNKTEALLSIMKISDLEIILQSSKNMIPESMLLYSIGMKYVKKKDNKKAKEILTKFISKYPEDPNTGEAKKNLREIEKSFFVKNAIGCMLPLSGKYQVFGKQALRGIQMALNDAKALYSGKNIIFDIKDTESDDNKAIYCVQELANSQIAAIAGPMVTSEAAAKEAQQNEIPMVCMTQKSEVTATGDYIFANFITPEMQVKGLVSHAREVLGVEKFAVLSPNDKYGQTFTSLFKQAVNEAGGEIVSAEVYREQETNFSDITKRLASILQSQQAVTLQPQLPDDMQLNTDSSIDEAQSISKVAIFIPDSPLRVAKILPKLTSNNIQNVYLLGTNIWHNKALLKVSSEHIKNSVITDGFFAQSRKPEAARFTEAFKAVYGEEPEFIEAIAYDTASMLIKTAMDKSINSRVSVKNALAGNIIYNGVTGETMFDENRNVHKELFFLTIENNSFVEIDRH
ncbi:MAG: penicillin-binding protein activator [Desulfamplus sp.]|nr:penicillin-binding protein activator [Desulfamplus sp.]MBF0302964.1 penicillin-binding protein activator [Desulfamplus sp.]